MGLDKKFFVTLVFAGFIRYFLITSKYAQVIKNRIEVSTPLNSWKRVEEGAFLYGSGVDPYVGDVYHENPLVLVGTHFLIEHLSQFIPMLFVLLDLLTGVLLYFMSKRTFMELVRCSIVVRTPVMTHLRPYFQFTQEKEAKASFAEGTEEIQLKAEDGNTIPLYTLVAYLFNPYSILSCVGQTTTVWSNFLLAIFFYCMIRKWTLPTIIALALETQRNFYPVVLIVPAVLVLTKDAKNKILAGAVVVVLYCLVVVGLSFVAFSITGNWKFIDSTLGFM